MCPIRLTLLTVLKLGTINKGTVNTSTHRNFSMISGVGLNAGGGHRNNINDVNV